MKVIDVKEDLIRLGVIPQSCPDSKVKQFLVRCELLGLNPFRGDLYIIPTNHPDLGNSWNILCSIGGLRNLASQLEDYTIVEKTYNDETKQASCRIKRAGKEIVEVCTMKEYAPYATKGTLWRTKPAMMLLKTCEAMALRSAFPELYAVYITEEFDRHKKDITQSNSVKSVDDLAKLLSKK